MSLKLANIAALSFHKYVRNNIRGWDFTQTLPLVKGKRPERESG